MQISNCEGCARVTGGCIEARGAPCARRSKRSLTTEDDDDDDLAPRVLPTCAALVSHSCVVGLRARLKPERFWFDSRGWDDTCRGLVAKLGLQRTLNPPRRRFESDRAHAMSHRTQHSLPTMSRVTGAGPAAPPSWCVEVTGQCATLTKAGSTPVASSRVCPRSTTVVQRSRKPRGGSSNLLEGSSASA